MLIKVSALAAIELGETAGFAVAQGHKRHLQALALC